MKGRLLQLGTGRGEVVRSAVLEGRGVSPLRAGERALGRGKLSSSIQPSARLPGCRAGGEAGAPTCRDRWRISTTADTVRDHSLSVPVLSGGSPAAVLCPDPSPATGQAVAGLHCSSLPGGQALKHHRFMAPTSSDVFLLFLMQGSTWSLSLDVDHQRKLSFCCHCHSL